MRRPQLLGANAGYEMALLASAKGEPAPEDGEKAPKKKDRKPPKGTKTMNELPGGSPIVFPGDPGIGRGIGTTRRPLRSTSSHRCSRR